MFYAQVLGLWLFLLALAMMVHSQRLKKLFTETLSNPSLMHFSGMVALGIGLLIVVSHNIWVAAWPVVITLFGWVMILQGVMRIFWPESFAKFMRDLMAKNGYTILNWIWLVVGLYLIWAGFAS